MIALAVVCAVIVLIALLPVGVRVQYDADGPCVHLLAGPIRIRLFPRVKQPQKQTQRKDIKPPKKTKTAKEPAEPAQKKGGGLAMMWSFVRLGVSFLGELRRKLLVRRLQLHLTYGGDDPAKAAIQYGNSCAALHALWPVFDRLFRIRRPDVRLIFDAQACEITVRADVQITIRVGRVIALGVRYGLRAFRIYLNHQNSSKQEKAVSK